VRFGNFPDRRASSPFVRLSPELTLNGHDNRHNDDGSAGDECGDV
jgi:hypothetical protein